MLHRDLKSDNVLVWKFPLPDHQNTDQEVLLKIADYGISRMSTVTNEIRYGSIGGTPGFIPPEVYTANYKNLQSNKVCIAIMLDFVVAFHVVNSYHIARGVIFER